MYRYVVKRFLLFIPSLIGGSLLVFGVMHVLPGDPAFAILGGSEAAFDAEKLQRIREDLRLNDPLAVQYGRWMWSLVSGEFGGQSYIDQEPIGQILARRLPVTLQLAFLTVAITLVVAIPAGFVAALHQDRWVDYVIRVVTILGLAMPNFWVALLILLGLVLIFSWSPPLTYQPFWQDPATNLQQMIWPALILSWSFSSYLVRVTRAQVLEVLRQDFVRTAYSKGLPIGLVMRRHVLRNVLIPVVTLAALHLDAQISGSLILENIFGLPGIGQGIVRAAVLRDYPVIQSLAVVLVFVALAINLLVDLVYALIDPRIRYR